MNTVDTVQAESETQLAAEPDNMHKQRKHDELKMLAIFFCRNLIVNQERHDFASLSGQEGQD